MHLGAILRRLTSRLVAPPRAWYLCRSLVSWPVSQVRDEAMHEVRYLLLRERTAEDAIAATIDEYGGEVVDEANLINTLCGVLSIDPLGGPRLRSGTFLGAELYAVEESVDGNVHVPGAPLDARWLVRRSVRPRIT